MRPWAFLSVLLAACATAGVRANPDAAIFEPPQDGVPSEGPDAGPDADFQNALSRFATGEQRGARSGLEAFLRNHPVHPARPAATALYARVLLQNGEAAAAKEALEKEPSHASLPAVAFTLGLAESRLGHAERALSLLRPFADSGPPPVAAIADPEADLLLRTALAEAYEGTGNLVAALVEWDSYHQRASIAPHEKAYARIRAEEIAGRATAEVALQGLKEPRAPLAIAALGIKAASAMRAKGDELGARRLEEQTREFRRALGFEKAQAWVGTGDPSRVGLAVPLSGRFHVLGEVALRGAMFAAGDAPGTEGNSLQVLIRDTGSVQERIAVSTSELTRAEAVIGVVGVPDRQAFEQTARDGTPFLVLDDQAPGAGTSAFQLVHSADSRATELARRALAMGARTFGILRPDSQSGSTLGDAFRRAVASGGGRVVVEATYVAGSSSFTAAVERIRKTPPHAVFVPDDSEKLELVAPALAFGELWSRPGNAFTEIPAGPSQRRSILLLSTARGLSKRLVKNAGRYVQGALLAPGFFASTDDPRSASFVSRYQELYGQDPSATDAYSHDGVQILRIAVARGAKTRADVLGLIGAQVFEGVTGDIRFGANHARIDRPPIYVVDGDEIRGQP